MRIQKRFLGLFFALVLIFSNSDFLDGKNYMGARYKSGMTSSDFDNVLYTAKYLTDRGNISYK